MSKIENSSISTASRHALIYGAAVLMQRAISIVMLPVYTRYLTPTDYGVSQLLDMTVDVAGILLVAGTITGMQRLYFAATEEGEKKRIVSTTLFGLLAQGLAGTLILYLLAPLIWRVGLSLQGSIGMVRLSAINFTLGLLPAVPLLLFQIESRPLPYALAMLAKLSIQLSLNILFVVGMDLGVWGILLSTTIGSLLVGGVLVGRCLLRTGATFDMLIAKAIGRFGAPYRIAGVGSFLLTFGDRFFLEASYGVASVGLYAISYQFGFLLGQIGHTPVMSAWEPQRYRRARESDEALARDTTRGFMLYNVAMLAMAVVLACGARPALHFLVGPEFRPAADVVPIVVAAYVFNGWYAVVKFGIDLSGATQAVARATWISVIVTFAAYALLIPPFGAAGAAWATLIGFVTRFVAVYPSAHAVRPLPYGWRRIGVLAGVAFGLMVVSSLVRPTSAIADGLASVAEVFFYFTFVWFLILRQGDRDDLRKLGMGLLLRVAGRVPTTA